MTVEDELLKQENCNNRKKGMTKVITETTNSVSSLDTTGRRDQFDNTDHMPHFDSKKEATRCKLPDCKGKVTYIL
jgi:hypothetical protein